MKIIISLLILSAGFAKASETDISALESSNKIPVNLQQSSNSLFGFNHLFDDFDDRHTGSYYDWGTGQNGWGYCYQWASNGAALNQGRPVDEFYCEQEARPSRPRWGTGQNGWGYCYRYTPYGVAMNEGRPIDNYYCEIRRPSYYSWGTSQSGYTYCYQYTPKGVTMNEGKPVDQYYCEK